MWKKIFTDISIKDMLDKTYKWIIEYRKKHSPMSESNLFISIDPAWEDKECTIKWHYKENTIVIDDIIFANEKQNESWN